MSTKWKPARIPSLSPYLIVEDVDDVIQFLEQTFDARLDGKIKRPNGSLMHAEVHIDDSLVMLGEPMGGGEACPANMFVYVTDPAMTISKGLAAGGQEVMPLTDMNHSGVRYGGVKDPGGNVWWIGQLTETVSWEEQQKRIYATAGIWDSEKREDG